ncbi:MAG: hypothetical protein Q7J04_05135 [Microcella sp.]|nr:hypothetical protein [Microcella sp.]
MPRSNRPRSRRSGDEPDSPLDLDRITTGLRRTVTKRSGSWNLQQVSAASAQKVYVCPGCRLDVPVGQAHIVAWRADGPMSDEAELSARRHWHTYCWRMEP